MTHIKASQVASLLVHSIGQLQSFTAATAALHTGHSNILHKPALHHGAKPTTQMMDKLSFTLAPLKSIAQTHVIAGAGKRPHKDSWQVQPPSQYCTHI